MKITRKLLKEIEGYSRRQLKDLHIILTGRSVFCLKAEMVERVREAICDYLGIDD